MPTIEEEGLLPTSLPLGLALLLVACELALPSRHAKSTTKDTRRIRTMQPRRAGVALSALEYYYGTVNQQR